MSEHMHRHNKEGPCHFSLMSLSATKRLGFVALRCWRFGGWWCGQAGGRYE